MPLLQPSFSLTHLRPFSQSPSLRRHNWFSFFVGSASHHAFVHPLEAHPLWHRLELQLSQGHSEYFPEHCFPIFDFFVGFGLKFLFLDFPISKFKWIMIAEWMTKQSNLWVSTKLRFKLDTLFRDSNIHASCTFPRWITTSFWACAALTLLIYYATTYKQRCSF